MATCALRGTHLLCGQVSIGSRHCSSVSGYDVSCIWNCGGWSGFFAVAPSLSPHQLPYVDTYLLRHRAGLNWGICLGNTHVDCGFPGVFFISSVEKSDCTGFSCELVGASLSFSASKIGCSKSYPHALAYKSS